MLAHLLRPTTPAEQERIERERVVRTKPHLAFVCKDPGPDPSMFDWHSLEDLIERGRK